MPLIYSPSIRKLPCIITPYLLLSSNEFLIDKLTTYVNLCIHHCWVGFKTKIESHIFKKTENHCFFVRKHHRAKIAVL